MLQQTQQFYWYHDIFFYLFVVALLFAIVLTLVYLRKFRIKANEMVLTQHQHVAKIDNIRKEHSTTLENIRVEMLKREGERSRQWIESEKETLHVLNGVSTLLDLSEKIGRVESDKILKKLDEIQSQIINKTVE